VIRVESSDVLGGFGGPVIDGARGAAMTSWFIAKFPCKGGG